VVGQNGDPYHRRVPRSVRVHSCSQLLEALSKGRAIAPFTTLKEKPRDEPGDTLLARRFANGTGIDKHHY
jgi:hypothetical protein